MGYGSSWEESIVKKPRAEFVEGIWTKECMITLFAELTLLFIITVATFRADDLRTYAVDFMPHSGSPRHVGCAGLHIENNVLEINIWILVVILLLFLEFLDSNWCHVASVVIFWMEFNLAGLAGHLTALMFAHCGRSMEEGVTLVAIFVPCTNVFRFVIVETLLTSKESTAGTTMYKFPLAIGTLVAP